MIDPVLVAVVVSVLAGIWIGSGVLAFALLMWQRKVDSLGFLFYEVLGVFLASCVMGSEMLHRVLQEKKCHGRFAVRIE